jgi:hypothetical protein
MGAVATIERADEVDPRFLHALLYHLGLPRSAVAERSFTRAAGNASILVEAGQRWTGLRFEPQPLPYGSRLGLRPRVGKKTPRVQPAAVGGKLTGSLEAPARPSR